MDETQGADFHSHHTFPVLVASAPVKVLPM
jgi:hypothetical protein